MTTEAATAEPSEGPSPARTEASVPTRSWTSARSPSSPRHRMTTSTGRRSSTVRSPSSTRPPASASSGSPSPTPRKMRGTTANTTLSVWSATAKPIVWCSTPFDGTKHRPSGADGCPQIHVTKRQCPVAQKRASGLLCSGRIRAGEVFSSAPPHLVQVSVRRHP